VVHVCKEAEPFLNACTSIDGCNYLMKLLGCDVLQLTRPLDEQQISVSSGKNDDTLGDVSPKKRSKLSADLDASSICEASPMDPEQGKIVRDHTVRLIHNLFIKQPGIFLDRPQLLGCLKNIWFVVTSEMSTDDSSSMSFRSIESLCLKQRTAVYLCECLVGHCRVVKDDDHAVVDALLTIVHVFKISQSFEFSSVTNFLSNEVPKLCSKLAKQTLIRIFFQTINNPIWPSEMKVKSLQVIRFHYSFVNQYNLFLNIISDRY